MGKFSLDRYINDYVRLLMRHGWTVWRGAKHYRIQDPTGRLTLTIPYKTGESHGTRNWFKQTQRAAREAGVPLPADRREP